jgi:hypothetical protein
MILSQNDVGITFFLGFDRVRQYLLKFQKICYGTQRFYGIPKDGSNACELNIFGPEQCPSNSSNQNN